MAENEVDLHVGGPVSEGVDMAFVLRGFKTQVREAFSARLEIIQEGIEKLIGEMDLDKIMAEAVEAEVRAIVVEEVKKQAAREAEDVVDRKIRELRQVVDSNVADLIRTFGAKHQNRG
jgi:hypothetical protein